MATCPANVDTMNSNAEFRGVSVLHALVKAVTPPVLYAAARWFRHRSRRETAEYEFVPEGWRAPLPFNGWDAQPVLDHYRATWPDFVRSVAGTQPQLLPAGYGLLAGHNVVACFSYALALASRQKQRVSLLDWGGGIGHYYLRSQAALPGVPIEYHCKDVPLLAKHGQLLFPEAVFYSDDSCLERTYDLVLAATSLHYSEDWKGTLTSLARATDGYLLLNRLPCHRGAASYVYRHRALGSEFLSWSFNADELLACAADAGLTLRREFLLSEAPQLIRNAPCPSVMSAYLFHRHEKNTSGR